MTRFLLEKPANFNDIERVVLSKEDLAIDSTVFKKIGKPVKPEEALTPEQIEEAVSAIENNNEMSCINCHVKKCGAAKRSILYAFICAVNQLKKSFTQEILEYLVAVLNQKKAFEFFSISEASSIGKLFLPQEEIEADVPALTCKQLTFIIALSEKIIYAGLSLYIYLLNKSLAPFLVSSFAVYLEAVGCDLKFLEDIIAINVDNRTLVNELTLLEKFFYKRNNKKGKGTPEMLETCLLFIDYKKGIKDLKFKIKDFFGGQYNPPLKKTFWETKYLSKIWKSTGFNLQKITLTAANICSLFEIRNQELVGNYYGEEK
jgi:hypothetical protein